MPKSAKNGTAIWEGTKIEHVTTLSVNDSAGPQEYATSSTGGKAVELAGIEKVDISFTVADDDPVFSKGDIGTLVLKSDAGTTLFDGRVLIRNTSTTVNVGAGAVIETAVACGRAE